MAIADVNVKLMFGAAIRKHRFKLQISQEELAHRAGLHRTYISDVERGARNVSLESIDKLARALEISVSNLFLLAAERCSRPDQHLEILLIEDNPHDVELTSRAFRKAGIINDLLVVRDGAEALEFLFATGAYEARKNQPQPGIILLDLGLPKVPGLEVLRRIKLDERTREIPVIVLTVSKQNHDIAACGQLGVDDYIVKPVGFRNFSEVTPHLLMEWVLKKGESNDPIHRRRQSLECTENRPLNASPNR